MAMRIRPMPPAEVAFAHLGVDIPDETKVVRVDCPVAWSLQVGPRPLEGIFQLEHRAPARGLNVQRFAVRMRFVEHGRGFFLLVILNLRAGRALGRSLKNR